MQLLAWWAEQRDEDLFVASLTIAEIRRGILEKPRGKKRDLLVEGKAAGRPRSALDMIIAAVAGGNDCVVVTTNEKDFKGLQIVNHRPPVPASKQDGDSNVNGGQCPERQEGPAEIRDGSPELRDGNHSVDG